MAIQDIRSNLISQFLGSEAPIGDSTTPFDGVVDNAHYELGVMFSVQIQTAEGAPSVTNLVIQESEDPTFATFDTIDSTSEKYIGTGLLDFSALSAVPTATVSATVENRLVTIGVFSNRRYLRLAMVNVGGNDSGLAFGLAVQKAELVATEEP